MDGYFAESWPLEDWRSHVEDDLAAGAFPEIEGLHSTRLSDETFAQFDTQEGTLLIAGIDKQQLLSSDEVHALVAFLKEHLR